MLLTNLTECTMDQSVLIHNVEMLNQQSHSLGPSTDPVIHSLGLSTGKWLCTVSEDCFCFSSLQSFSCHSVHCAAALCSQKSHWQTVHLSQHPPHPTSAVQTESDSCLTCASQDTTKYLPNLCITGQLSICLTCASQDTSLSI